MVSQIKKIDTNSDGRISTEEYKQHWDGVKAKWDSGARQASAYSSSSSSSALGAFADLAAAKSPTANELSNIENQVHSLLMQMEQAKTSDKRSEELKQQYENLISQYDGLHQKSASSSANKSATASAAAAHGKSKGFFGAGGLRGSEGKAKSASLNPASAQEQTYGSGSSKALNFSAPAQWGDVDYDLSSPNASTLMQSSLMKETYIQNAWDDVNNNSKKGKELMMLFFYYARMAESGDMGAVYQFMKFITYIISKDKAKQQIEMGKKLIELQEVSRQWTNKLLDLESNSTDASASGELMKMMTIVKSETDAIATSQKLISQMMEEFAQVVETLTNTTKGALETQGRMLRTVSTFR